MQYLKLNGLTGFLLAVVLLLGILVFLVMNAITTQQKTATQYYEVKDAQSIGFKDAANQDHLVLPEGVTR